MSVRESFVKHFGEEQAQRFEDAAYEHAAPRPPEGAGSDPFKWVLCITIGWECFSNDDYRKHHGITVPVEDIKNWIKEHGELSTHDGDFDALAAACGIYNEYIL